jgi:hypothetical protein
MPHNLFTSTERLLEVAGAFGYLETEFEVTPMFAFRSTAEHIEGQVVKEFTIHVPGYVGYDIRYQRNPTGKYLRFSEGKAHRDDLDGEQVRADNIIVQLVATKRIKGDPEGRLEVQLTGSGQALVFTAGRLIEATWKCDQRGCRTRFADSSGELVQLTPGKTHILILPLSTEFDGLPES